MSWTVVFTRLKHGCFHMQSGHELLSDRKWASQTQKEMLCLHHHGAGKHSWTQGTRSKAVLGRVSLSLNRRTALAGTSTLGKPSVWICLDWNNSTLKRTLYRSSCPEGRSDTAGPHWLWQAAWSTGVRRKVGSAGVTCRTGVRWEDGWPEDTKPRQLDELPSI